MNMVIWSLSWLYFSLLLVDGEVAVFFSIFSRTSFASVSSEELPYGHPSTRQDDAVWGEPYFFYLMAKIRCLPEILVMRCGLASEFSPNFMFSAWED